MIKRKTTGFMNRGIKFRAYSVRNKVRNSEGTDSMKEEKSSTFNDFSSCLRFFFSSTDIASPRADLLPTTPIKGISDKIMFKSYDTSIMF